MTVTTSSAGEVLERTSGPCAVVRIEVALLVLLPAPAMARVVPARASDPPGGRVRPPELIDGEASRRLEEAVPAPERAVLLRPLRRGERSTEPLDGIRQIENGRVREDVRAACEIDPFTVEGRAESGQRTRIAVLRQPRRPVLDVLVEEPDERIEDPVVLHPRRQAGAGDVIAHVRASVSLERREETLHRGSADAGEGEHRFVPEVFPEGLGRRAP